MILLAAVIAAQLADAATWLALPRGAEANAIVAHWHSWQGWAAKALLVVAVLALSYAGPRVKSVRRWPFRNFPRVSPAVARAVADVVVIAALVAGSVGVGANVSVLVAR